MPSRLNALLLHFNQLSEAEQVKFITAVKTSGKVVTLDSLLKSKRDDGIRCPHCQSTEVVPWGKRRGVQWYKHKDWGRTFSDLPRSILWTTKKLIYKYYIKYMVDGLSVRKSAAICKTNRNTAFM